MKKRLRKKPVLLAAAALGAAAVLAAAFLLQPGKPKEAAVTTAEAAAVETVQQEQNALLPFDVEVIQRPVQTSEPAQPTAAQAAETAGMSTVAGNISTANTTSTASTAKSTTQSTAAATSTASATKSTITTTTTAVTTKTTRAAAAITSISTSAATTTATTTTTTTTTPAKMTCTVSICCDTILANMAKLKAAKAPYVPANGMVLQGRPVTFTQGESAFDVLRRVTQSEGLQMEFSNVPAYGSAYIEGIANLYEFDCGPRSGWMYRVNGVFPNYGCSKYTLRQGDVLEFVYTCDLGQDIGGGGAAGQRT